MNCSWLTFYVQVIKENLCTSQLVKECISNREKKISLPDFEDWYDCIDEIKPKYFW